MDQYIRSLENEHLRDDLQRMGPDDTVRVSVRIKGNKKGYRPLRYCYGNQEAVEHRKSLYR